MQKKCPFDTTKNMKVLTQIGLYFTSLIRKFTMQVRKIDYYQIAKL